MNAEAFTSTSSAAPDSLVSEGQVLELLDQFSKTTYRARDKERKHEIVERRCLHLFAKDYKYSVIHNGNGELCNHYPTKLILLEYELSNSDVYPTSVESLYDLAKMQELFTKARFARCRSRFVIPVLLYEGKQICRSSTLSAGAEIYGRSGLDYLFNTGGSGGGVGFSDVSYEEDSPTDEMLQTNQATSGDWQLMDRIRGQDIKLLKLLSVGYVCDLMVEKKKVKFGMSVTSSEKADKEHRYSDFCLMSLPYPGCEFFKDYKDNKYVAEGLSFDWTQGFVDAELQIPGSCKLDSLGIDWTKYRKWDLVTITSNYLKLFLHILKEGDCGVLIHCISGWDRTPLYISLLRLSLWADGKMHKSLSPIEMLYLTIAYDWLLFGHNLIDRVGKGEEIFFFCFNFLKNISSEEFSLKQRHHRPLGRLDSDSQFDNPLLLDSEYSNQCSGSSTSLNSACSVTSVGSTSSPIVFNVSEKTDREDAVQGNSVFYRPLYNNNSTSVYSNGGKGGTSPVPVPLKKYTPDTDKSAASSGCGSWQIISRAGSCKDSVPSDSSNAASSSGSSSSGGAGQSHLSFHNSAASTYSERHQKLSAVRMAFIAAYDEIIGYKNGSEASVFSSMLDNLASKIGIKSRLF